VAFIAAAAVAEVKESRVRDGGQRRHVRGSLACDGLKQDRSLVVTMVVFGILLVVIRIAKQRRDIVIAVHVAVPAGDAFAVTVAVTVSVGLARSRSEIGRRVMSPAERSPN
jgi:hypothetical protein